jgi:hypothetical protein
MSNVMSKHGLPDCGIHQQELDVEEKGKNEMKRNYVERDKQS